MLIITELRKDLIWYIQFLQRDERRRVTHNEVERRRRNKINTWITKLGKLLPECDSTQSLDGDGKPNLELLVLTHIFLVTLECEKNNILRIFSFSEQRWNTGESLRIHHRVERSK